MMNPIFKNFSLLALNCSLIASSSVESQYKEIIDQSNLKILTPSLAERQTAKLRLKNGLEMYLVSDPGIEQSAAALAVKVGSWQDPREYPGMAHLLEHMLFMGNKAYPDESEYMRYISDNGGLVNAYTASERTVYMFSINNEAFTGALDRFSHFFIDPLFHSSSISRELHAVDQEHAKNIENDNWRQYMIFKETGNQNHPNAKFSTGNAKTLKDIPQQAMQDWYKKHYSADRMHLIVLSALPLDKLIQIAVQDFSKVPVCANQSISTNESMTSSRQRGHFLYVQPVKDLKVLSLTWELPRNYAINQEAKVGELIAHVLQSSLPHTLKGELKKAHLIEDLSVNEEAFSKEHKLFTIELQLTELGLKQTDRVIQHCFAALSKLKRTGIPSYIFEEVRTLAKLQYQYQSRQEAFEFVREQAHFLVDEDLSTYPLKTLLPTTYDLPLIHTYLEHLTTENCIFSLLADPEKTKVSLSEREKWMGATYAILTPTNKQFASWNTNAEGLPSFELPPPNPYLPTDLASNDSPPSLSPSSKKNPPQLLVNDSNYQVYFASDQYYLVPEIAHTFRIKSPLIDGTARSEALLDLYVKALEDKLLAPLSLAKTAGLNVDLCQENFHFLLRVNGYQSKSSGLILKIFDTLKEIQPTREEFELYRASLTTTYDNASKELPFIQAHELLTSILSNCAPLSTNKLSALSTIRYEDFIQFSSSLLKKAYVQAFLYGNLTKSDAQELWKSLSKKMDTLPYPPAEQFMKKVLVLPEQEGPYMVVQKTAMQGNAALLAIEEGPYSLEKRAAQQVLAKALKEDFFDTLRTKQQTAYIARAWATEEEGHLLHYFIVQSNSHQPGELIARFELLLENFLKNFSSYLSVERFENVRKMLIASLQMRPENLLAMSKRWSSLAFDYKGDFDLIERRISSLEQLTYPQLHELATKFFSRTNTQRLAILTEGNLPKEKTFRYEATTDDLLRDQGIYLAWK